MPNGGSHTTYSSQNITESQILQKKYRFQRNNVKSLILGTLSPSKDYLWARSCCRPLVPVSQGQKEIGAVDKQYQNIPECHSSSRSG